MDRWKRHVGCFNRTLPAVAAIGALFWATGAATAGELSANFFYIEVSSTLGSDSFTVLSADVPYDPGVPGGGGWSWAGGGIQFDNGIASLDAANLTIAGDPQIALGFTLSAGPALTTVTISSAVLSFGAMGNPHQCLATVAPSITDLDQPLNGATLTGCGGSQGSVYVASYNVPPGTVFAEFVQQLQSVPPDGSAGGSGNTGVVGISGAVTSMQVQFEFTLSAGDQVSATSNYIVMPEPASLALMVVGAVALRRRRG